MSIFDQLGGILNQYSSGNTPPPEQAPGHFQQVATQIPRSQLGGLLTNIFQSPETGTFGDNVSQMYGQSNPQQRAGILSTLLHGVGPEILSRFGLPTFASGTPAQVSAEQAQQISPEDVKHIANHAQQQNPGIVQQAGEFYSQHPQLVQALGAGVAIWAMQRFRNP
jgi:hypothetical protein